MIDGESSKAELLQSSKSSSGDMTTVILNVYLIKISQDLRHKARAEGGCLYNYTKSILLDHLNYQSDDRRHGGD